MKKGKLVQLLYLFGFVFNGLIFALMVGEIDSLILSITGGMTILFAVSMGYVYGIGTNLNNQILGKENANTK